MEAQCSEDGSCINGQCVKIDGVSTCNCDDGFEENYFGFCVSKGTLNKVSDQIHCFMFFFSWLGIY